MWVLCEVILCKWKKNLVRNLYYDFEVIKIEKIDIIELVVFIMVLFYYINIL